MASSNRRGRAETGVSKSRCQAAADRAGFKEQQVFSAQSVQDWHQSEVLELDGSGWVSVVEDCALTQGVPDAPQGKRVERAVAGHPIWED